MTIGTGHFLPSAKFAFPRAYYRGIGFDIAGYTVTAADYSYRWVKVSDPFEIWTIAIDPRFYYWSSNRWTLDFVMTDFYYQIGGLPTRYPQPYTLQTWTHPNNLSPYLLFQFSNIDFGEFHWFDFPPAPPGYWRPPFPNG